MGGLWGVFCEYVLENWLRYNVRHRTVIGCFVRNQPAVYTGEISVGYSADFITDINKQYRAVITLSLFYKH